MKQIHKQIHSFKCKLYLAALATLIASIFWAFSSPSDSWLRDRAVKIQSPEGSCSGEQIQAPSGANYILTAAHCRSLMDSDSNFEIKTEDGKVLKRRLVGEDPAADLLLIEGIPGVRGLTVADYALEREHVRTFTSGAGFKTYETDGRLVQYKTLKVLLSLITDEKSLQYCRSMPKYEVLNIEIAVLCILNETTMTTTASIVPGSSGGMVVDDLGRLVGVVSAGDGKFGYLVSLADIKTWLRNY